jgi:hypothetical protein
VTLIFVVIVVVLAALIVGRSVRRRRNIAANRAACLKLDGALQRGPDAEEFYAPSFIVVPGKCFRLCRDADTGTAFPCDNPVEGTGQFRDHRGNPVTVESCGKHGSALSGWEFKQLR